MSPAARVGIGYESNLIKWVPCELKWTKNLRVRNLGSEKSLINPATLWETSPGRHAKDAWLRRTGGNTPTPMRPEFPNLGQRSKWSIWSMEIIRGCLKLSKESGILNEIWLVVSIPLKNMLVTWDDYSQYMEKNVPKHQPEIILAAGNTFFHDFWLR